MPLFDDIKIIKSPPYFIVLIPSPLSGGMIAGDIALG
jgi:hypothetical protein